MPDNYFDCFLYENGGPKDQHIYPFDGYQKVLDAIRTRINIKEGMEILDIGIGGGMLSYPLYCKGANITGIDSNDEMLEGANKVMHRATLIKHDIRNALPEALFGKLFDNIISSYALHHLPDGEKTVLLKTLISMGPKTGEILIADVSFETRADMEKIREEAGDYWDSDEFYIIADEYLPELERQGLSPTYKQISSCAGVLAI